MMMLSFLFLLVGDILLGLDYWTTVSIPQGMLLLPWLGSALFFALAALHARPATVRNRTVRPLVRSMVVYTPVLIAYLIGFYQLVWGELSVLEMAALVVTGILASGNHVAIFVENARLTQSLRTNLRTLAESERRFRLVLDELAEGVAVAGADGTVRSISARITDLLGWRPAQLVGRSIFEFVHPDDLADVRAGFDAAIGGGTGNPIMLRVLKTDGTYAPVEAEAGSYIEETAMSGLVISVRDLTLRLRQEALLREAEQRFRVAFEEAPIGILLATTSGHLIQVNAAFGSMLGLPTDQVEGRHLSELGPISELAAHDEVLGLLADAPAETTRRHRFRYQHANGAIVVGDTSISVIEQPDGRRYLIGQVQDVTRENAIAERLAYSAHHDELTGLLNRAAFMERLSSALIRRSAGETVGVIFLDVDRFKMINDSLGHAAGDRVVKAVGQRLRVAAGEDATVARFGGDEFVVYLTDRDGGGRVDELANTLAEVVTEPMSLIDGETFVTVSVGVATADRAWVTADSLVRDADAAMYQAKDRGRNRVEHFEPATRDSVVRLHHLGNELHRAIERDDFALLFQPIVELRSGRLAGFEALVRWDHPERGIISPIDFIELAEDTGLIVQIGQLVMDRAMNQLASWQRQLGHDADELTVSINLSARQLARAGARAPRERRARPLGGRPVVGLVRDHRERARGRPRPLGRHPRRPAAAGCPLRHRRLRHRLLVAQLPPPLPGRVVEDRPQLRPRAAPGQRRRDHHLGRHPPRPLPQPAGHGGGRRAAGPADPAAGARLRPRAGPAHRPAAAGLRRRRRAAAVARGRPHRQVRARPVGPVARARPGPPALASLRPSSHRTSRLPEATSCPKPSSSPPPAARSAGP